ncbi:MAG: response regulator [Candidatus Marinimicrobia bacterium]|nr:response regulator [Candidatus Neomarinimicrobiota bacterium]
MKILIVDDSEIIYKRIEKLITPGKDHNQDSITVISKFDNLLMDIYHMIPDVIIMNTYSLRGTLIETIRAVKTILPSLKIIALTEFFNKTFGNLLKKAGSDYFIDIASGIDQVPGIITNIKNRFN